MDRKVFLRTIRSCLVRLYLAGLFDKLVSALGIGAAVGIVFQAVSFVVPVYYVNLYMGILMMLAVLVAFVAAFLKRATMEQAALLMDGFGFQERIITAYENRNEEGPLVQLQREDAMRQLAAHRDRIRIPLWPSWKKTVFSVLLLAGMFGLALTPSKMKDRAKELHQIEQQAGEKEKEIEEVIEELSDLESEELTPQQFAALQEMAESLQSSLTEYRQADTEEALEAAGDKLNYKYGIMSSQIEDLARSLQNGGAVSGVTAQSMQAMAQKLREKSGNASQGPGGENGNQGGQSGGQSPGGENGNQGGQGDGQGTGGEGSGQGTGEGQGSGRGTGSSSTPHDYVSVPNAIADSESLTGNAYDHDASEYFRAQNGLSWEGNHVSHEAVIGSYERNAYEGIAAGKYPSGMENVIKEYFASFNQDQ